MIDPSEITILIPHLGADEQQEYAFDECLKSLLETGNFNIMIVKNGLKDCTSPHPFAMIINDQGQCKAVNAAAATVNTPWIFVTNDDMVYAPGWWKKLTELPMLTARVELSDQNIMCISPQLVEPKLGAPTFQVQPFGGAGGDFDKAKWLEFASNYPQQSPTLRTGFSLPFLIKKDLWDLIGGYDINFDPWGSNGDSDLEYKIKLAGVQPYQNTNCIVYHFSQTSGTFNPENQSYWQHNWDYFIQKWGFPRTDEGIWEANFQIPDKERLFRPWWENFYGN